MREILAGLKSAAKDLTGLGPMAFGRESGNIIPILLTRRPSMINIEAWLAFPARLFRFRSPSSRLNKVGIGIQPLAWCYDNDFTMESSSEF